ncbi:efflux RND transporter periplasmic adaptor subunit [Bacteroidota bacterium]
MKKLILFLLASTIIVSCGKKEAPPAPPQNIPVVKAKQENVPIMEDFVGQTYGYSDINIRARVDGFLEGIFFIEGSRVKKGQLLYAIDPESYQASVNEANSMLAQAQTMLVKAENDLNRIRPLAEINAVSKSDLDAAVAQYGAAKASVEAAEAGVELAKIQLGYTKIYSPITGTIGITEAKVGDFVGQSPNPVVLNTVSRTDTIMVRFSITESDYLRMARYVSEHHGELDGEQRRGQKGVSLILADGSTFKEIGFVDFINRNIDPSTGTIMLQASFPNPNRILRPGQFAKVRGIMDEVNDGILIPQRCVSDYQGSHFVYTISDSNMVVQKDVKIGPTIGEDWLVLDGLKAGETVVYEGLQKIKPGMIIVPVPAKESKQEQQ